MARKSDRNRELSEEEQALWEKVTRTAAPLSATRMAKRSRQDRLRDDVALPPSGQQIRPDSLPARTPDMLAKAAALAGLPVTGLDRRTGQRLRRGQLEADATVDLHGLTQARAHQRLIGFIREAQARGHRMVLVITGKGKPALEPADDHHRDRHGVLRHVVPDWLAAPELRCFVIGFQRAHPRHGGDGALYVRIRRQKLFQ